MLKSLLPLQTRWPLLSGGALALCAFLPSNVMCLLSLVAIITLGVPHGALDGEMARDILRPRMGWLWFPAFSIPYLLLSAFVLITWHVAPLATLAAFLAVSTWHFGSEGVPAKGTLDVLVQGGLPIALPVLAHPTATAAVFAAVAGVHFVSPPHWLWAASFSWLGITGVWVGVNAHRHGIKLSAAAALLVCMFVVLPPLLAFTIYFVCLHGPAHTAALIHSPTRASRVHDLASSVRRSFPITVLTIIIGAALWPLYSGSIPLRLLSLTLQLLAALTLPHMLFELWLKRRDCQLYFAQAAGRPRCLPPMPVTCKIGASKPSTQPHPANEFLTR